jgi:hypothetical protein
MGTSDRPLKARCRVVPALALALALTTATGCGSNHSGSGKSGAKPATPPSPAPSEPSSTGVEAATSTLRAVFVHPTASQCTTAMTVRYQQQAFATDAANSATSVKQACAAHQRARAALTATDREVTVEGLTIGGASAQATLRGSNGYPLRVLLVADRGRWRLDAIGAPQTPSGGGAVVAPPGSLYAYRIPPGYTQVGTRIGTVKTTGAGYSTAVSPRAGRFQGGIAVAQTVIGPPVRDQAVLRAELPHLERSLRAASTAQVIGAPRVGAIGGRPAVTWHLAGARGFSGSTDGETVFVFSSAQPIVIVNCRWPHTGAEQPALRHGCAAVLGTIRVG